MEKKVCFLKQNNCTNSIFKRDKQYTDRTGRQAHRQAAIQTAIQTGRQPYKQAGMLTDRL